MAAYHILQDGQTVSTTLDGLTLDDLKLTVSLSKVGGGVDVRLRVRINGEFKPLGIWSPYPATPISKQRSKLYGQKEIDAYKAGLDKMDETTQGPTFPLSWRFPISNASSKWGSSEGDLEYDLDDDPLDFYRALGDFKRLVTSAVESGKYTVQNEDSPDQGKKVAAILKQAQKADPKKLWGNTSTNPAPILSAKLVPLNRDRVTRMNGEGKTKTFGVAIHETLDGPEMCQEAFTNYVFMGKATAASPLPAYQPLLVFDYMFVSRVTCTFSPRIYVMLSKGDAQAELETLNMNFGAAFISTGTLTGEDLVDFAPKPISGLKRPQASGSSEGSQTKKGKKGKGKGKAASKSASDDQPPARIKLAKIVNDEVVPMAGRHIYVKAGPLTPNFLEEFRVVLYGQLLKLPFEKRGTVVTSPMILTADIIESLRPLSQHEELVAEYVEAAGRVTEDDE